jgi:hypothetical protein
MRQDDDYRRGRHVVAALNVQLVFVTNVVWRMRFRVCPADALHANMCSAAAT